MTNESLAARARRMGTPLLDESRATFVWLEDGRQHGGHNQTSWAEALVDALPAMFPPAGA